MMIVVTVVYCFKTPKDSLMNARPLTEIFLTFLGMDANIARAMVNNGTKV